MAPARASSTPSFSAPRLSSREASTAASRASPPGRAELDAMGALPRGAVGDGAMASTRRTGRPVRRRQGGAERGVARLEGGSRRARPTWGRTTRRPEEGRPSSQQRSAQGRRFRHAGRWRRARRNCGGGVRRAADSMRMTPMVDLREPLDALIRQPRTYTGHLTFPAPEKIFLYDDTLRDGEQMPGVAFSPAQKAEAGGAAGRDGHRRHGRRLPDLVGQRPPGPESTSSGRSRTGRCAPSLDVLAMCRAVPGDIDCVLECVAQAGARPADVSVLILSTLSDLHLKYKLGRALLQTGRPRRIGVAGHAARLSTATPTSA